MQTAIGVKKAKKTMLEKYGGEEGLKAHYKEIALLAQQSWAENGRKPRGFKHDRELAKRAGRSGGLVSKRKPAHKPEGNESWNKLSDGSVLVGEYNQLNINTKRHTLVGDIISKIRGK